MNASANRSTEFSIRIIARSPLLLKISIISWTEQLEAGFSECPAITVVETITVFLHSLPALLTIEQQEHCLIQHRAHSSFA